VFLLPGEKALIQIACVWFNQGNGAGGVELVEARARRTKRNRRQKGFWLEAITLTGRAIRKPFSLSGSGRRESSSNLNDWDVEGRRRGGSGGQVSPHPITENCGAGSKKNRCGEVLRGERTIDGVEKVVTGGDTFSHLKIADGDAEDDELAPEDGDPAHFSRGAKGYHIPGHPRRLFSAPKVGVDGGSLRAILGRPRRGEKGSLLDFSSRMTWKSRGRGKKGRCGMWGMRKKSGVGRQRVHFHRLCDDSRRRNHGCPARGSMSVSSAANVEEKAFFLLHFFFFLLAN